MRIGMVLDQNYPEDIRVRKEAEALVDKHTVFVLCKRAKTQKLVEKINGVTIYRAISYKNEIHQGIIDVIAAINFVHPIFKKELPRFIEKNDIEVLHVHDLPLAKTVYNAAKKYSLKSVLDLHENYPEALNIWFSWRKNPLIRFKNRLFFSYKRWNGYEASIIHQYDKIIAVVDEMKAYLIKKHTINGSKITVITNTEKRDFAEKFTIKNSNYFANFPNRFIISYVGGMGPHRGLHTVIEAMKDITQKIPNALLVLVGPAHKDVRKHLENLISKHRLTNVLIKGRTPFDTIINIMKNSNINIIPHVSNEHTENTIPHKFFQILLSKKPLLTSDCAPMKRLINQYQIGTYFETENAKSFSEAVFTMYSNYKKAIEKATKGYELATEGHLNWEHTSKKLIHLYDTLLN